MQDAPSYLPARLKKKGRWTHAEHAQFIDCLKKYGKDWEKLDEMIITRDSLQIRSHSQKYFNRIKQDFNTDDPIEYIRKGMCDVSPFYKFDKSKFSEALMQPEVTENRQSKILQESLVEKQISYHCDEAPIKSLKTKNITKNCENRHKKRHLKQQIKYFGDSSSSEFFEDKAINSYKKSRFRQVSLSGLKEHARRVHRKHKKAQKHFSDAHPGFDKISFVKKAIELSTCASKQYASKELSQCTTKAQQKNGIIGVRKRGKEVNTSYRIDDSCRNIFSMGFSHSNEMAANSMTKVHSKHQVKREYINTLGGSNLSYFQPLPTTQKYCSNQGRFVSGNFQTQALMEHHNKVKPTINPQYSWKNGKPNQQSMQSVETSLSQLLMKSFQDNYCVCKK
ncbi:unnamed protein product [Moneuplotes crassus]|uniref:Uncharacterized protein n=1 Tax=Euplotes crassus TaxID=5936 RepID=A0AAD1Y2B4_EUPCR|nr:unnamed protein product [Moneuplotes crassus]